MKNKKRGLFLALPLFAALSLGGVASAEAKPKNFSHQEYATSGTWHIESEGGKRYIVLSKKFRTAAGPDLKIYLSPHKIKGISGRNVTKGAIQCTPGCVTSSSSAPCLK